VPIPDDMLPPLLSLLSKLEIAVQVDKRLVLVPSLLPESINYPPPIYVGLSKKAFVVSKDNYDVNESPRELLKSVSDDSSRPGTVKIFSLDDIGANCDPVSTDNRSSCASAKHDYTSSSDYPQFNTNKSFDSLSSIYHQFVEPFYQSTEEIEINIMYHPPLFRIWLAHFIPEGFWPRLICRIASDPEIDAIFTKLFPSTLKRREASESHSLNHTDVEGCFLWNLWKTGLVFVDKGVTLLELKQNINEPVKLDTVVNPRFFSEKYYIDVAIHISSFAVVHKHDNQMSSISNKDIVNLGTKLLVLIEQHVIDVGSEWYYNTLSKTDIKNISSYVLCSECVAGKPYCSNSDYTTCYFMSFNGKTAACFEFKEILESFVKSKPIKCPYHQEIPTELLAPDIVSHIIIPCSFV